MKGSKREDLDSDLAAGLGLNGLSNPSIRAAIKKSATSVLATGFAARATRLFKEEITEDSAWCAGLAFVMMIATHFASLSPPKGLKEFLEGAAPHGISLQECRCVSAPKRLKKAVAVAYN